jgi:hypothetical protein
MIKYELYNKHIYELRQKALEGDKQALDEYSLLVEKGLVPPLHEKEQNNAIFNIIDGYAKIAEERGEPIGTNGVKVQKFSELFRNPFTLLADGYAERQQKA